jgi:hypothetical protein
MTSSTIPAQDATEQDPTEKGSTGQGSAERGTVEERPQGKQRKTAYNRPQPRGPIPEPAMDGALRSGYRGTLRHRLELAATLLATAALYLWNLGASGWANAFYSAAAQAGSQDWTAWFFGSSDAANAITVDKPPASLWIMGLSVRLFGLNAWSILVPEALMGVAAQRDILGFVRSQFLGAGF